MMLAALGLVGGVALLYVGGEALVGGASRLALRTGLPPLAVGLTVVAFGTSSPELAVSVQAALGGLDDVALGNAIGSNICNIALILGVAALIRPLRVNSQVIKLDVPIMIAVSCLLWLLLANGVLSRGEGALLLTGIVAYTWMNLRQARREPASDIDLGPGTHLGGSLSRDAAWIAGGLACLIGGGRIFVDSAIAVAQAVGLSQAFIALTVVAVGTSLPELTTSVLAALRGEDDLAIGNIIGSNVFNILGILGTSALVSPLVAQGVNNIDLGVMLAAALVVLPMLITGARVTRLEGAFLLAGYASYVAWRL